MTIAGAGAKQTKNVTKGSIMNNIEFRITGRITEVIFGMPVKCPCLRRIFCRRRAIAFVFVPDQEYTINVNDRNVAVFAGKHLTSARQLAYTNELLFNFTPKCGFPIKCGNASLLLREKSDKVSSLTIKSDPDSAGSTITDLELVEYGIRL